jgi:hypothetical protein
MQYARITRLSPIPGHEEQLCDLLEEYLAWLQERPGFLLGLCLTPMEEGGPLARVTMWEGRGWADATALSDHALAVRSQLMALTTDQTIHEEEFAVHVMHGATLPASICAVTGRRIRWHVPVKR